VLSPEGSRIPGRLIAEFDALPLVKLLTGGRSYAETIVSRL
jgi:hypothetical protein